MSRASIVKMYMKEHPGVSLPMASKAVKEKGLYVAKSAPKKAASGSKKKVGRKPKGGMKVAVTVSSTRRKPKKARKAKSGSKKSKK